MAGTGVSGTPYQLQRTRVTYCRCSSFHSVCGGAGSSNREYEKERMRRIQKNEEILKELGLPPLATSTKLKKPAGPGVGGTLHGRIIEEGNVSVAISSIVPGSEGVWLYEANNDNEPPMVRVGDALNSMTKWPLEAVKAA